MTNQEISRKIQTLNNELRQEVFGSAANFTLNQNISLIRNKIKALEEQCTHRNNSGEFELYEGHCVYCGKKM